MNQHIQHSSVLAGTARNLEGFTEAVKMGIDEGINIQARVPKPNWNEPYMRPL